MKRTLLLLALAAALVALPMSSASADPILPVTDPLTYCGPVPCYDAGTASGTAYISPGSFNIPEGFSQMHGTMCVASEAYVNFYLYASGTVAIGPTGVVTGSAYLAIGPNDLGCSAYAGRVSIRGNINTKIDLAPTPRLASDPRWNDQISATWAIHKTPTDLAAPDDYTFAGTIGVRRWGPRETGLDQLCYNGIAGC